MSAIEVLKEWNNKPIIFDERFMTKEDYIEQVNLKVATQEALLALEQKEKLVEWLEKEIALWKVEVEKSKDKERYEDWVQSMIEQRLWAYEEVLERVGEQK